MQEILFILNYLHCSKHIKMSTQITISGQVPYKSYVALVSQSGIDAPTAVVLENTIGPVTWVYGSAGYYLLQLTGAFPPLKTFCPIVVVSSAPEFATNYGGALDYIEILTSGDDILHTTPIEIRVYN
jgi:hypothetical protein